MHSSVEYREEPCKTALNPVKGMAFGWSLNPYMGCVHRCTYCYVRAYEKRADRPSDERYGRSIRVKTNVAQVLRYEVRRRSWQRWNIAIGAATDPYQPAEGKYKLTRGCLQVLAEAHNPFGLITRGPMIVRDIDVLQEASRRAEVSVSVSIPTLDLDVWRKTEPGTAPPHQRLRAVREMTDAGIKAGVAMAPLLPSISDSPAQVEEVVRAAHEAGAVNVWANLLHLRSGTREHFLSHLARDWPELLQTYREMYARDAYLPDDAKAPTLRLVAELRERYGVGDHRRAPIIAPPKPEQLSLLSLAGSLTTAAGSWVDLETRILRPESHRGAALVSTH
ncbi:MAG TPA: radical SAM protein [Dehalococcoidia bacterium]|nr:radical SAM protein [Dehalococcoidia bacterium]